MENKTIAPIVVLLAIVLIAGLLGINPILTFAPIAVIAIVALTVGKLAGSKSASSFTQSKTNNSIIKPTSMHDMYQYQNSRSANKSEDDFCHNQHQAERLVPDDIRSELEELKSLLNSGLMERAEYNDRVNNIRTHR